MPDSLSMDIRDLGGEGVEVGKGAARMDGGGAALWSWWFARQCTQAQFNLQSLSSATHSLVLVSK